LLCENHLKEEKQLAESLAHELIHAYDDCTFEIDWDNPEHHVCSEIRASNLSGECRFGNEFRRGKLSLAKVAGHYKQCVRRRALMSLSANPNGQGEKGERALFNVWPSCYNNFEPFEELPFLKK